MSLSSSPSMTVEQRILHRLSTCAEEAIPYERLKKELQLGSSGGEGAVRQLLEQNRVRLSRGAGADAQIYISIVNNISENYSIVLDLVRASGSSGIDQAQLLLKARMPKTELVKAVAALLSKNLIKEHRSVTNRAKRIYTLFNIDPSSHVTGGTMYCGEELDVAFVDEWRRELTRFISTRRMVSFDQIKRHVEAAQGGGTGSNIGNSAPAAAGSAAASASNSVVFTMIDTAVQRGGGATPSSASSWGGGGSSSSGGGGGGGGFPFVSKQLSEQDLRTLVHTLVLDGVLEMLIPASAEEVHRPQYQLATGQSVMRHFTAQRSGPRSESLYGSADSPARQRARHDRDSFSGGLAAAGGAGGGSLLDIEGGGLSSSTLESLRQASRWEPAPVSLPSSREAVNGWAYMPAVGIPCLGCPLLTQCSPTGHGVVNPKSCAYLKDWLS